MTQIDSVLKEAFRKVLILFKHEKFNYVILSSHSFLSNVLIYFIDSGIK